MLLVFTMFFFCITFLLLLHDFSGDVVGVPAPYVIDPVCQAPRGTICMNILKCAYFADLLARTPIPRPLNVIQVIKKHQCGFDKDHTPKVCCTSPSQSQLTNIFLKDDKYNYTNLNLLPKSCGAVFYTGLISRGSEAALMEFPWMALLVYNNGAQIKFRCAATLINERYVLTAAHCVVGENVVGVRIGEYDLSTLIDCDQKTGRCSPPVHDVYTETIIVHPEFNMTAFTNDIALIRVDPPVNLNAENARPICLPVGELEKESLSGKFGFIAGWGTTEHGFKSTVLRKAKIPILHNDHCRQVVAGRVTVTERQICAGGFRGGDACGGDSGGPLMVDSVRSDGRATRFVQHGIISSGPKECGIHAQPGVYTRVGSYVRWILENMKP